MKVIEKYEQCANIEDQGLLVKTLSFVTQQAVMQNAVNDGRPELITQLGELLSAKSRSPGNTSPKAAAFCPRVIHD